MAIEELAVVVAPPLQTPKHSLRNTLSSSESALGVTFPKDFVELNQTYGNGSFFGGELIVLNVFDEYFVEEVLEICDIFQGQKDAEGDELYPYDIHPAQPGLLPWGTHPMVINVLAYHRSRRRVANSTLES